MKSIVTLQRTLIFLALALLWAWNSPYDQISTYISSFFPWPNAKSWKWAALLIEGALIQVITGFPMALLLTLLFRTLAVRVACVLAAIFAIRAFFELPSPVNPPYGSAYIVYIAVCHFLLLVGLTIVVRNWVLRLKGKR